ncbi:MAG: DUF2924 domain-containing protein [Armatimonadota bacterium]
MPSPSPIAAQLHTLQGVGIAELRRRYRDLFGEDTPSHNRDYLFKRIAWRLQEQAYGGLSDRATRRLEALVDESLIRQRPPAGFTPPVEAGVSPLANKSQSAPRVGTVLRRLYKNQEIAVTILENGVLHDDVLYTSLTAAARAITGTHTSGRLFFGLAAGKAGTL